MEVVVKMIARQREREEQIQRQEERERKCEEMRLCMFSRVLDQ